MRPGASVIIGLLAAVITITHAHHVDTIDNADKDEFLEVREDHSGLMSHLRWLRSTLWDSIWDTSDDHKLGRQRRANHHHVNNPRKPHHKRKRIVGDDEDFNNVDSINYGSGDKDAAISPTNDKEVTVRVTFIVEEPYVEEFSNRDTELFQELANVLSDAVNPLYDSFPGKKSVSLVRIESIANDPMSCKVTLDVTLSNGGDPNKISEILRNHIKTTRKLGILAANDKEFTHQAPGVFPLSSAPTECHNEQFRCISSGACIHITERCDGRTQCSDGSDEENCVAPDDDVEAYDMTEDPIQEEYGTEDPTDYGYDGSGDVTDILGDPEKPVCNNEVEPIACGDDHTYYCPEQRCNGESDCYNGVDEEECYEGCGPGMFHCDVSRCIAVTQKCDHFNDCTDGTDESDCPEDKYCTEDDFRCDDGQCIDASERCNKVANCPNGEDERDCTCDTNEFQCISDGACIQGWKRCDGTANCQDGSDEANCSPGGACKPGQWMCDFGTCINLKKRCNGRVDCPSDRSDERNCSSTFKCEDGSLIPVELKCNRKYDCPGKGDESDEINCPCGNDDFMCNNGYCIPASRQCDGFNDCQDKSDETNCIAKRECTSSEFRCTNGDCISSSRKCDDRNDCSDGSDEVDCHCAPDEFRCWDGKCFPMIYRCNGLYECSEKEDELNCGKKEEPNDCVLYCNGRCVKEHMKCDGINDCENGEDEQACQTCFPDDFRCVSDGACISKSLRCNGKYECNDRSDEYNCDTLFNTDHGQCRKDQFKCCNGKCIPGNYRCDNLYDCTDFSDEQKCFSSEVICAAGQWKCKTLGECIDSRYLCDGAPTCQDGSDEHSPPCSPPPTTQAPFYWTQRPTTPPTYATQPPFFAYSTPPQSYPYPPPTEQPRFDQVGAGDLKLRIHYGDQKVEEGAPVVFFCRDESETRAPVSWYRADGRPLPPTVKDLNGRLELDNVKVSDSGVYVCRAKGYDKYHRGAEATTNLKVSRSSAISPIYPAAGRSTCGIYEATCTNGDCIPKNKVCNGIHDCADGSDEDRCGAHCGPNMFRCNNTECVGKHWVCDGENDCKDGSDETQAQCNIIRPGQYCKASEFACASGEPRCIPRSFHCDNEVDCDDKSDELGCLPQVYFTEKLKPYLQLQEGETMTLTCTASGVPTPHVSWRRNWGNVPDKCTQTSVDGVGTLICPNIHPRDNGAYSCEAANNKDTAFGVPDTKLEVIPISNTGVCPDGFFNSEARTREECVSCFCFGATKTCKSADLYTYQLQTPLGEGGTRLITILQPYRGALEIQNQSPASYYYQAQEPNAVTVIKNSREATSSRLQGTPYLALPETYNGNQLTSYGGTIRYKVTPHNFRPYPPGMPEIVIKGTYKTLTYMQRQWSRQVEVRLLPEMWTINTPGGARPASREDIMMALDSVEGIYLLAEINNAGVNITEFKMDSAQPYDAGLGAASLVEECECPPGHSGLSCQKCKPGYKRVQMGPWLGQCVSEPEICERGFYGDPALGIPCRPCPCPLTNKENQFANTCHLDSDGDVSCDCPPGYGGRRCEYCMSGYVGNPLNMGDRCLPQSTPNCNPIGTEAQGPNGECYCKENVEGVYCNECKSNSFFLAPENVGGCTQCFCSGIDTPCGSSNLRRKTNSVSFGQRYLETSELKVFTLNGWDDSTDDPQEEPYANLRHFASETVLQNFENNYPKTYYWAMPKSFAGDKVTAYGGYLHYYLKSYSDRAGQPTLGADVLLISKHENTSLVLRYYGKNAPTYDSSVNGSVQLLETNFKSNNGLELARGQFLVALAELDAVLIKATHTSNPKQASIVSASIETAEVSASGPRALHVEHCQCPEGYIGTSCEECAPGYYRVPNLYLGMCEPCSSICNNRSSSCDPRTKECYNCADNFAGPTCDECAYGYSKDAYGGCSVATPPDSRPNSLYCDRCDERGSYPDCYDRCQCKPNVQGETCSECRPGTFGLSSDNDLGCYECFCSGVTNQCEQARDYHLIPKPAPVISDDHGFSLTTLDGSIVKEDLIINPEQNRLMHVFGTSVTPVEIVYWALPYTGNLVTSYGGKLQFSQIFQSSDEIYSNQDANDVIIDSDRQTIFWRYTELPVHEVTNYNVVNLVENDWRTEEGSRITRAEFMEVLSNVRRILVKATLSSKILNTVIADVSLSIGQRDPNSQGSATSIEVCRCPQGYEGTSCEQCSKSYYKDENGRCQPCPCIGHFESCALSNYGNVECHCLPPYTGSNCTIAGLLMELRPILQADYKNGTKSVELTCRYQAPEPLSLIFIYGGKRVRSGKHLRISNMDNVLWNGNLTHRIVWDPTARDFVECHALTRSGFVLGILTSNLTSTGQPMPSSNSATSTVIINTRPQVQIREVGKTVVFYCNATSVVSPGQNLPVHWEKKDGELPRFRYYIDEKTGSLTITGVKESDSGIYVCTAGDGISIASKPVTLTVPSNPNSHPIVKVEPPTVTIFEGESFELQCIVGGNPLPNWAWTQGVNRPLPLNAEVSSDGVLRVRSASLNDSTTYRCIATNAVGSSEASGVVVVLGGPNAYETLVISPPTLTIWEGSSNTLVCRSQSNSLPSEDLRWSRYNGPLPQNYRQSQGILYIERASPNDSGVYTCQSANSGTRTSPATAQLIVKPQSEVLPSPQNPNVRIVEYQNGIPLNTNKIIIPSGESRSVDCMPVGVPEPYVKWTKYSASDLGPHVSVVGNLLVFNGVTPADAGLYLCEGFANNQLVASENLQVAIEYREPPRVMTIPSDLQIVNLGSTFEITCRATGIPKPDITWQKDGSVLSRDTQLMGDKLLFSKVSVNDEGTYTCTGSSVAGHSSSSTAIKVQSSPIITIKPKTEYNINTGESLRVECRAEGYPQPTVYWKRRGVQLTPPTTASTYLAIDRAITDDEGDYECEAENSAGKSIEAIAVYVEKMDNLPIISFSPEEETVTLSPGQTLKVECTANGYDVPNVNWNRSTETGESERVTNPRQGSSLLLIEKITEYGAGLFTCVAENKFGTSRNQLRVYVSKVDAPSTNIFEPTRNPDANNIPYQMRFVEGQDEAINCPLSGDYVFEITRVDNARPLNQRLYRNQLIIYNTSKADEGFYECKARDPSTGEVLSSYLMEVEVLSTPVVKLRPKSQVTYVGDSPTISCVVVKGDEPIEITWSKQGGALPRSAKVFNSAKNEKTIQFESVSHEDSGTYRCEARNRYGEIRADAVVSVKELISSNQRQHTPLGSSINLHCIGDGGKVTWEHAGKLYRRPVYPNGTLPLRKVSKHDAGIYSCIVAYRNGTFGKNHMELVVDDRQNEAVSIPQPPESPVPIGSNLDVECTKSSLDIDASWNKVDEYERVSAVYYRNESRGALLVLKNIQPQDEGRYRCTGYDPYSSETFSDEFQLQVADVDEVDDCAVKCDGSRCITEQQICDDIPDCNDGYDEIDCSHKCQDNEFRCNNGECIWSFNRCNQKIECSDGSDEESCEPAELLQAYETPKNSNFTLPCHSSSYSPSSFQWRKEGGPIQEFVDVSGNELRLTNINETDAGPYVCTVRDGSKEQEKRILLKVTNVVPLFKGDSWIQLGSELNDSYDVFDVVVNIRPLGNDGVIFYNSENDFFNPDGAVIILALANGRPEFTFNFHSGLETIKAVRPLELNQWHKIKISRTNSRVQMFVDNELPQVHLKASPDRALIKLRAPFYVGGVPDINQLPPDFLPRIGFLGCISVLNLNNKNKVLSDPNYVQTNVGECNTCDSDRNSCKNDGFCQDAATEQGFICFCGPQFSGNDCSRAGASCKPGVCGLGRCKDLAISFKCECPINYFGERCEHRQLIEFPAFTGNGFIAFPPQEKINMLWLEMKVNPSVPVTDGVILYGAETPRGFGAFLAITVNNGYIELRVDAGDSPVVVRSKYPVDGNKWTHIDVRIMGATFTLTVDKSSNSVKSPNAGEAIKNIRLQTPLYIGGYDDDTVELNKNVGVTSGFVGCVKDWNKPLEEMAAVKSKPLAFTSASISSLNVYQCGEPRLRGDPLTSTEVYSSVCSQCKNGGRCSPPYRQSCVCPPDFEGKYCEKRRFRSVNPCDTQPCTNGGTCSVIPSGHKCDCPLGFYGFNCNTPTRVGKRVYFGGDSFASFNPRYFPNNDGSYVGMAISTTATQGLLFYQFNDVTPNDGRYILLQITNSALLLEWNLDSGRGRVYSNIRVNDGNWHNVVITQTHSGFVMSVDQDRQDGGASEGYVDKSPLTSDLYIGGVPKGVGRDVEGFKGCIQTVELGENYLDIDFDVLASTGQNLGQCASGKK